MKRILIISLFLFANSAYAINKTAEDLIINGLTAYQNNDAHAAIKAWIKGSGLEGSKEALSQANTLKQIEDFYGAFESYEVVKSHKISNRSSMVQFVINYNKGITYARFQAYKTKDGNWITTEFKFHTEATQIWPVSDVYGSK